LIDFEKQAQIGVVKHPPPTWGRATSSAFRGIDETTEAMGKKWGTREQALRKRPTRRVVIDEDLNKNKDERETARVSNGCGKRLGESSSSQCCFEIEVGDSRAGDLREVR